MNIASVQRFSPPGTDFDPAEFFRRLQSHFAARVHGVPFMTRRLKWTPFELDQPVWVTDSDFDIAHHVFRTRLSAPGTERQLNSLIAQIHEQPFDRRRPLWQIHFIDGLEDGSFAIYNKYHHAAVDGVSGQMVMNVMYSDAPDLTAQPVEPGQAERVDDSELIFDAIKNMSLQPFEQLAKLAGRMRAMEKVSRMLREPAYSAATALAPKTPLNVRVGPYRNYCTTSLPLNQMRLVGKLFGASVNDVLLAVCAGALREYLQRRQALPDAPLIAGIPVSLRDPSDRSYSNKVGMLRATLATHLEEPLARLEAISESTLAGKKLLHEARSLIPEDAHIPGLSWLMQGAMAVSERLRLQRVMTPACNVLVSNVPGPRKTQFLLGARMLTHHPVSIAADGNALNITVQSYGGRLDLGITSCLDAVPDIESLRDDLDASWQALRLACEPESLKAVA